MSRRKRTCFCRVNTVIPNNNSVRGKIWFKGRKKARWPGIPVMSIWSFLAVKPRQRMCGNWKTSLSSRRAGAPCGSSPVGEKDLRVWGSGHPTPRCRGGASWGEGLGAWRSRTSLRPLEPCFVLLSFGAAAAWPLRGSAPGRARAGGRVCFLPQVHTVKGCLLGGPDFSYLRKETFPAVYLNRPWTEKRTCVIAGKSEGHVGIDMFTWDIYSD